MITYEKYAEFRDKKGMKDADVARSAKIPPSTFTEWKKGEYTPKFDKMCKIAEALGMFYMELVDGEGRNSSENPLLPQDKDRFIEAPNNLKQSELIELYEKADPKVQDAVLMLLKSVQQDP